MFTSKTSKSSPSIIPATLIGSTPNALDLKAIIQNAISPLILEIKGLKEELKDLKAPQKNSVKTINNQRTEEASAIEAKQAILVPATPEKRTNKTIIGKTPKIVQLAQRPVNSKPLQARAESSEQRKTFAEIVRLNSLEKDSQIVQSTQAWTTVAKKQKSLPRELAPKRGLDPVDRRVLFTRLETGKKSVVLPDLLLAINLAIKKIGLPEHIRLTKLWFTPSGVISGLLKEGATGEMLLNA